MSKRTLEMLRSTILGNDAFTSLLLHCDGADAATSTLDYSPVGHTMTFNGNAQLDTAQFKFGRSSILFDGTDDWVDTPVSSAVDFNTGDFTLDMWIRLNGLPGPGTFYTFISKSWIANTYSWFWGLQNTAGVYTLEFFTSTDGQTGTFVQTQGVITPTTGTWHHVALTRSGTTLRHFFNGALINSGTNGSSPFDGGGNLHIGISSGATNDYNGWMDEIRISKGIARWTAAFTPPGQPYG